MRLAIQQHLQDVDRPHSVHEAVVGLLSQRPAPVLQAIDQDHLPQRSRPVEWMGEELGDPLPQLGVAARRRQRGAGDVIGDVEALVVNPMRP